VDDLIRNLEETRRAAAAELAEARRLREENQRLREELVAARAELEARRQAVLEKAREEARRLLHAARREAEAVLAELRRLQRQGDLEAARKARRRLDQLRDQLDSSTPSGAVQGAPLRQDQVVAGLAVLVPSLQQVGIVTEPPGADGQVAVQVGGMRVRVPWHELRRAPAAAPAEKPAEWPRPAPRPGVGLMAEERTHLSPELHVRGMTVEEALEAVDKYLDDAVLAGLSRVRIVHGKGTGTLRRAIHEHLRADRRVKAWRLADPAAGGHGVTEAELAD
ncbi:MAG: Smr/MutS family protein, partial [Limnochordales bacterium]